MIIAVTTHDEAALNALTTSVQAVCEMMKRTGPDSAEYQVAPENRRFFDVQCEAVGIKESRTVPTLFELVSGPFKVLTISQPWASLIAEGRKWVENRSWESDYSGPLAIHAGKGSQYLNRRELAEYETGAIIAVADLVACLSIDFVERQASNTEQLPGLNGRTIADVAAHPYTEGPFCWVLQNVRPCVPFRIGGHLGLWTIEGVHP